MKSILPALLILASSLMLTSGPVFAAETKRVCTQQTDPKTKKVREVCRQIKVHKKLEGTPVPRKKAQ